MAIIIHRGATLTPHFRDFLPGWVARQPWYRGTGVLELTPVGYFRFEDPAGAVGVETHLLRDGSTQYQVPLTYRDARLRRAAGRSRRTRCRRSRSGSSCAGCLPPVGSPATRTRSAC